MIKYWKLITHLGVLPTDSSLERRSKILCNQINLIIIFSLLTLLIMMSIMNFIDNTTYGFGALRILITLFISIFNLGLAAYKKNNISKVLLIFLSPSVFILLPTFVGFVEAESFVYYPYTIVSLSVIPQLLLIPKENKLFYWLSLSFYLVLLCTIDLLLKVFTPINFSIISEIESFFIFFKASHILIFLLVNFSVYYLRKLNNEFEIELEQANSFLEQKSIDLINKNQMLETNQTELLNKNETLENIKKELNKQNGELTEALTNLNNARQKLILSEKMASLGILTAGVAHEINNPLNYIAGGAGILESDVEELLIDYKKHTGSFHQEQTYKGRISKSLDMIREGVRRCSEIVGSLRDYSGYNNPLFKEMDIHKVIESAIDFLSDGIKDDIKISKHFNLSKPVLIIENKMHQVFINMLDNAIFALSKSDNSEKKITIRTSEYEDLAIISITNNGPKIPEEISNKIFDPFFTTKGPKEGTGLGLSICYNIVSEHKGNIEVKNNIGDVGFIIRVPLKQNISNGTMEYLH